MHDIRPFLPELFTDPGTLLYIGARADAHSWLDELIEAGQQVTVVEIWPANVVGLSAYNAIQGDARTVTGEYDYIFWWHGPEHLARDEAEATLRRLETMARRTLAAACPFGIYPQGAHEGNPNEEHKTTFYPADFEALGYSVKTDGLPDEAGSEIVVWKRMGDIE